MPATGKSCTDAYHVAMTWLFETDKLATHGYAQVALEQGIDGAPDGLTYAIPDHLVDLHVGERVTVPLGRKNRPVAGIVIKITDPTSLLNPSAQKLDTIKTILSRDTLGVSLPGDLIELAHWIAGYYCCPLGMVFATMLPAAVKRGTGRVTRTMIGLPKTPTPTKLSGEKRADTTKLQKSVLDQMQRLTESGEAWVEIKQLAALAGARTITPIKQLIDKGHLMAERQTAIRGDSTDMPEVSPDSDRAIELTHDQHQAIKHLTEHAQNGFSVHLLHGVTGSGKTEVYLRVIEHVLGSPQPGLAEGSEVQGAIVLVPEIALTTQTIRRFVSRFEDVAALHSGLTAAQRHTQWQRIRNGEAKIVVGARSAIFAPLPQVGVIIVDEEHDPSYKQDQLPRYHARDVAIKRAQILGVPVVLGSATPSLESYFKATFRTQDETAASKRSYHLLKLPSRVAGLKLPRVEIVDMKQERRERQEGGGIHLLSRRLELAIGSTISSGGQTILLLNRRGYANYIACPDPHCGWLMNCTYCDAMMVYHKLRDLPTGGLLRCHHCRAEQTLPKHCPLCVKRVIVFGIGTQRVEEEIQRKFPGVRLLRMDSDSMHTGRDYQSGLETFRRGELDVLVGTQMIAKGLDFPNVRLVGVVGADSSLHIPDFRASERTFQLISQVAGRAGRGIPTQLGQVIVQSFNPQDPSIVLASRHDYESFAESELELRRQVGLSPWSRMVRIIVRDQNFEACVEQARSLAEHLERYNHELSLRTQIVGPMPATIARIADYHRQQIELTAAEPQAASRLQKLITTLRNTVRLRSDAHTAIDVDPVSIL